MEQIRNTLLLKLGADRIADRFTRLRTRSPDSKCSAALTPEDLHLLFDMALKGAQDLARASDPLLVLEMVLLRMTWHRAWISRDDVASPVPEHK